ncbi:hypothetical protein M3Y99_00467100 [Aphelenchoides fujianensis]|nr:hypothetical protein M3Y99_00467100 [Aphelenchoides fujianensis]
MLKYATGTSTMLKSEIQVEVVDVVRSDEMPATAGHADLSLSMVLVETAEEAGVLTEEQFNNLKASAEAMSQHLREMQSSSPEIEEWCNKIRSLSYNGGAHGLTKSISQTILQCHSNLAAVQAQRAEEDRKRISDMIDQISAEDRPIHAPPASPQEHVHDLVEKFENQAVIEQEAAEAEEVHHPDTDSVHTAEPPEEVKTAEAEEEVTTAQLPDVLHELKREQEMPNIDLELEKTVLEEDDLKTDGEELPTAVEDVPTAVEDPKTALEELPTAVEEPQSPSRRPEDGHFATRRIETTAPERPPPPADVSTVNSTVGSEAKPKKKKSSFRRALGLPRRLSQRLKERVFGHKEPKPPAVHVETEVQTVDGSLHGVPMDDATPSTSGLRPVLPPPPRPPVPSGSQQSN